MVHAGTGSPILGTYATAVLIIKLKMIANPCEVILLTSQSLILINRLFYNGQSNLFKIKFVYVESLWIASSKNIYFLSNASVYLKCNSLMFIFFSMLQKKRILYSD